MRFTLRAGTDPTATADRAMLAALGLPAGGVVSVGDSHVRVLPGKVPVATTMLIGPTALANAGLGTGVSADVKRVVLPAASTLVVDALPPDPDFAGIGGLHPGQLQRPARGLAHAPEQVESAERTPHHALGGDLRRRAPGVALDHALGGPPQ